MKLNGWQRLWIVFSVCWVAGWLWDAFVYTQMPWERSESIINAVLGPVVLYAAGWTVAWVIRGFRRAS